MSNEQPYVMLQTGDTLSLRGVQCFFSVFDSGDLAHLRPGDPITLAGRYEGLMVNVILAECRILE